VVPAAPVVAGAVVVAAGAEVVVAAGGAVVDGALVVATAGAAVVGGAIAVVVGARGVFEVGGGGVVVEVVVVVGAVVVVVAEALVVVGPVYAPTFRVTSDPCRMAVPGAGSVEMTWPSWAGLATGSNTSCGSRLTLASSL
jgi:hypothetical protein